MSQNTGKKTTLLMALGGNALIQKEFRLNDQKQIRPCL